jgi:UDP-N-acetylmuramoyl-tripeptide--D-alanyl-D-alanine ligase
MELTAREIAAITGTDDVIGDAFARARSWSNDSRTLESGACFVALVDARDGHDFVADAFARGATVALVTRPVPEPPPTGAAIVRVDDAFAALAALGTAARDRLGTAVVVGITGSSGKTGTKDLTAGALRRTFRVHASPGSFNNEIGLPITLLRAPEGTEALVLEMGARFPGNIADLCAIAQPDVGVITNVGLSHAGLLGGPEGIARVKGELLEALTADGIAVLDANDAATPGLAARTVARTLTVGVDPLAEGVTADVVASRVTLDRELRPSFVLQSSWGSGTVHLAVRGAHHVVNASLAAAVALVRGVPFDAVAAGLAAVTPAPGRMDVRRTSSGTLVIDDAYNANPASMAAALRALERVGAAGRTIAVVGDMLELGDATAAEHARVGEQAAAVGVDVLVTVGDEMAAAAGAARAASPAVDLVIEVADARSALDAVRSLDVRADDVVLVKGSHAIGLERVVDGLARPRSAVS